MATLIDKRNGGKIEGVVMCMYSHLHTQVQFLMIWVCVKKRSLIDSIKEL